MTQPMPEKGQWCHIEIPSRDPERAKAFYGEVLGWTFQDVPFGEGGEGTYTLYMTGDGGIGGGIWNPPDGMPRQIVNYVMVEALEPVCERAAQAGGKVVLPEQDVPGIGRFGLISDPDGNLFGIWEQGEGGEH